MKLMRDIERAHNSLISINLVLMITLISFQEFLQKYVLKCIAISTIKTHQVLSPITTPNCVEIRLRDGPFENNVREVNLHTTNRTHGVVYIDQKSFD